MPRSHDETRDGQSTLDPQLIDYHLDALDPSTRDELACRLKESPELAAQHARLATVFDVLRRARAASVAESRVRTLRDTICSRVRTLPRGLRFVDAPPAQRGFRPLREVAAVAAVIVLTLGLGLPGLLQMHERRERIVCSQNLASIGAGLLAYASASNGQLPFIGFPQDATWSPATGDGQRYVPNRRHLYPLLVMQHARPEWFVCPGSEDVPMPRELIGARDDFLESRNISYASQNMAGARPRTTDHPDLPLLSDDNPLFDAGTPLRSLLSTLGAVDATNSRTHGRRGQNILTLGGSVRWSTTPLAGFAADNIWTLNHVVEYTGREGPQTNTDSHLIK